MPVVPAREPLTFTRTLTPFTLEAGAALRSHRVTATMWSDEKDHDDVAHGRALSPARETVLLLPPLTHGSRFAGEDGYWDLCVGKGRPLRPWAHRLLSVSLLGGCTGTTGPTDPDFPNRLQDTRFLPCPPLARGMPTFDEAKLPATVTTWDQARSVLALLDALGIERVALVVGGSIGGMVALTLGMLAPARFSVVAPIAAPLSAGPWMIGWNHAARAAILADPTYPSAAAGLRVARQIARMTYRTPRALMARQGRRIAGPAHRVDDADWSSRTPYRVETYLDHAADTFAFDARAYLVLTSAMDHHDLARCPLPEHAAAWSLSRMQADVHVTSIDSDLLVPQEEIDELERHLRRAEVRTTRHVLSSDKGHDAFLCETEQLARLLKKLMEPAHISL